MVEVDADACTVKTFIGSSQCLIILLCFCFPFVSSLKKQVDPTPPAFSFRSPDLHYLSEQITKEKEDLSVLISCKLLLSVSLFPSQILYIYICLRELPLRAANVVNISFLIFPLSCCERY